MTKLHTLPEFMNDPAIPAFQKRDMLEKKINELLNYWIGYTKPQRLVKVLKITNVWHVGANMGKTDLVERTAIKVLTDWCVKEYLGGDDSNVYLLPGGTYKEEKSSLTFYQRTL